MAQPTKKGQAMKHYIAMSGSMGYLPDSCGCYESVRHALDWFTQLFGESISWRENSRMRLNLCTQSIHYFDNPERSGAYYASISMCDCASPEDHDE